MNRPTLFFGYNRYNRQSFSRQKAGCICPSLFQGENRVGACRLSTKQTTINSYASSRLDANVAKAILHAGGNEPLESRL